MGLGDEQSVVITDTLTQIQYEPSGFSGSGLQTRIAPDLQEWPPSFFLDSLALSLSSHTVLWRFLRLQDRQAVLASPATLESIWADRWSAFRFLGCFRLYLAQSIDELIVSIITQTGREYSNYFWE